MPAISNYRGAILSTKVQVLATSGGSSLGR